MSTSNDKEPMKLMIYYELKFNNKKTISAVLFAIVVIVVFAINQNNSIITRQKISEYKNLDKKIQEINDESSNFSSGSYSSGGRSSQGGSSSSGMTVYIASGNSCYHKSSSYKFLKGASAKEVSINDVGDKYACNCMKY
ncbi:hypothetical protein [Terrisporobacter vanillatitrophus]|uniref:hypothetical protein n=1 Tax=Terrisporobacter vanillatitrophus TaxID=3058402 RepID=UPI0033679181